MHFNDSKALLEPCPMLGVSKVMCACGHLLLKHAKEYRATVLPSRESRR